MKFVIDLYLDGYDTEEEMEEACREFMKEQLDFSASSVKIEEYKGCQYKELQAEIERLELELTTLETNALIRIEQLQDELETEIQKLRDEIKRQDAMDDELLDKVRDYVNGDHPLSVDMCNGTGRTGMYIETGFLRNLLNRIQELEKTKEETRESGKIEWV